MWRPVLGLALWFPVLLVGYELAVPVAVIFERGWDTLALYLLGALTAYAGTLVWRWANHDDETAELRRQLAHAEDMARRWEANYWQASANADKLDALSDGWRLLYLHSIGELPDVLVEIIDVDAEPYDQDG